VPNLSFTVQIFAPQADLIEHLQKAAGNGCAVAQYALGCHHEIGAGVPKDASRTRALYHSSAELGCTFAQEALAKLDDPSVGYNSVKRYFDPALEHEDHYNPYANKKWMDAGTFSTAKVTEAYPLLSSGEQHRVSYGRRLPRQAHEGT
jgi:hypothetical protein